MDLVKHVARALVEVHGTGAVNYAERAAVKARAIGLPEKAEIWGHVIAALKAMRAT
jgi:hypothetical protein